MTITPSTSKWTTFPADYRATAVAEILRWVTLGQSGVVVGTSGTGKSNIAGYLAHRPDVTSRHLPQGEQAYVFLLLDFNGLPLITTANFYRVMLYTLEEVILREPTLHQEWQLIMSRITNPDDVLALYFALQRAHQLLIDRGGKQIVWLFDYFDKGCVKLDVDTLNSLRNLRDQFKDRLTYVAFARAPLARLRHPTAYDEFHEIMVMHTCWVGAMSTSDGQWVADQVRTRYGKTGATLPPAAVDSLFTLCGGWPALLKVAYTALAEGDLPLQDDERAWQTRLLANRAFQQNCQEIWTSCAPDEQAVLRVIAEYGEQAKVRPADLAYLQQIGLLTADRNSLPRIFAPVFAEFIRRQHVHMETGIRIEKGMAYKDGVPLPEGLADLEFRLLTYFCRHAGEEVCLREEIDRYLWPDEPDLTNEGTGKEWERLRAAVTRLRTKIGDTRRDAPWTYIRTVHGRGYQFVQPPPVAAK